jgi:phosphoglycerol transferase MdoB-like AlkP superfamily enzyme
MEDLVFFIAGFIAFICYGLASRIYNNTKRHTAGVFFFLIIAGIAGLVALCACFVGDVPPAEVRSRM